MSAIAIIWFSLCRRHSLRPACGAAPRGTCPRTPPGPHSVLSISMSWTAARARVSSISMPPSPGTRAVGSRTSSPKNSVSTASTSRIGRTATRCGLVRSTSRRMPTRQPRASRRAAGRTASPLRATAGRRGTSSRTRRGRCPPCPGSGPAGLLPAGKRCHPPIPRGEFRRRRRLQLLDGCRGHAHCRA